MHIMYRVVLFITFLTFCFSAPISDSRLKKIVNNQDNDDGDVIDTAGSGYSFFKQQNVEGRTGGPSAIDMPAEDLAAYMYGSSLKGSGNGKQRLPPSSNPTFDDSFGQQQSNPRSNSPLQNLLPTTIQNKKPSLGQGDFTQSPSGSRNKFINQQGNFPSRSTMNNFGNFQQQQQQDSRGMGSLQFLLPQRNAPAEQPWSRQQKPFGFGAQGQQQQAFPSNNLLLPNQQRDQASMSDALLMSSQRFIPPRQPLLNNGW